MPSDKQKADFMVVYNAARELGIPQPEVIAAQWALESGWGTRAVGKFNYWNIKSGNSDPNNGLPGTVAKVPEYINGKKVYVDQKFKNYNNVTEAMKDRLGFTSKEGGRYDSNGYHNAKTPAEAIKALEKGKYATDPKYGKKLLDVLKGMKIDPNKPSNNPNNGKGKSSDNPRDNEDDSRHKGNNSHSFKIELITPQGKKEFDCSNDMYILDAAEEIGIDLPYSCRAGSCSSCVGKIVTGKVDQSDQSFLDDEQMKSGFVYLCTAYPTDNCVIETHKEDKLVG